MSYLVLGASGGLGRALCRRLAAAGNDLLVVSSDRRDLEATALDLELRFGVRVKPVPADVAKDDAYLDELEAAAVELAPLRGILLPVGAVLATDTSAVAPESALSILRANFLSVVAVVTRFLPALRRSDGSVVVGFGSVAAARGRGQNVVYAAAKRALESYFESLRHAFSAGGPTVQLYVLGYLDTSLASGRTKLFPKASPERLAERVLRDLRRDVGLVYFPWYWRFVRTALRWTPWPLYKRMRF